MLLSVRLLFNSENTVCSDGVLTNKFDYDILSNIMTALQCGCVGKEVLKGDYYCCDKCDSILDDLTFEDTMFNSDFKNRTRVKKFDKLILGTDLPWYVRESLLDLFPKAERYFYEVSRKNFINLPHLAREMCLILGYETEVEKFAPLKTKSRAKQVKVFANDMVFFYFGVPVPYEGPKIEDLEYDQPKLDVNIDVSKVYHETHVYS